MKEGEGREEWERVCVCERKTIMCVLDKLERGGGSGSGRK